MVAQAAARAAGGWTNCCCEWLKAVQSVQTAYTYCCAISAFNALLHNRICLEVNWKII
jgi:hypothetical protein